MKLIQAKFSNFRILKDFELEFSTDPKKPLTVVRAANESGKTTLLYALQWGLFGDLALPNRGKWRLSPIDSALNSVVEITSEINFSIQNKVGREDKFKLIRIRKEQVKGNDVSTANSSVTLFKLTEFGADEISHPGAWLKPHLPEELREVFFTDGDRALSFIEGKNKEQSAKVEGAIRSLLGLELIENAVLHSGQVKADFNRNLKSELTSRKELDGIVESIDAINKRAPDRDNQIQKINDDLKHLRGVYEDADQNLQKALSQGDKEQLAKDMVRARNAKNNANLRYENHTKSQTNLFKDKSLPLNLLAKDLDVSFSLLQKLYDEGTIPNSAVPILEDRLKKTTCFCGEDIDDKTSEGAVRRSKLNELVAKSRSQSVQNDLATDLYFRAKNHISSSHVSFREQFTSLFTMRQEEEAIQKEQGRAEAEKDAEVKKIPQQNITSIREIRDDALKQIQLLQGQLGMALSQQTTDKTALTDLEAQRTKIMSSDEKGQKALCRFHIADDLEKLLGLSLEQIKDVELTKVSKLMNSIFLDMIGASPEEENQSSIIQRAEINDEFIIVVHGNSNNELNPSLDLNGASRRALTIAFILALTKVSGVEAPNVIDTPLGMTSGYVKNSILRLACEYSSQLVMLLTHDEINGCEGVISKFAGKTSTFTNPAHYPKILINDPGVKDVRVIQCDCDHQKACSICERRIEVAPV